MKIPSERAIPLLNGYLTKCVELEDKKYTDAKEELGCLEDEIEGFIEVAFENPKDRRSRYYGIVVVSVGHKNTEREKQEKYIKRVKKIKSTVIQWKTEFQIYQETQPAIETLSKTEKEVEKAQTEANRRGYVVQAKVNGTIIELIDQLREQLKEKDTIGRALASIQADLTEIKGSLGNQKKEKSG